MYVYNDVFGFHSPFTNKVIRKYSFQMDQPWIEKYRPKLVFILKLSHHTS